MSRRTEELVCPHCKALNNRMNVLGTTGLVNYSGMNVSVDCTICKKTFNCDVEVSIKFTTRKH